MNDFTCDRCGESFGDVSTWNTDRAIVVDSLSGLNIMAMDLEREAEIDLAPQFPFQSLSISDDGSIADCLVGQSHRDEHALEVG